VANLPADEQDWHNADQFAAWLRKRADENRRVAALPPDQWPRSPSLLQHLAHRFEQGAAIVEQLEAARKRDFEQALANGTRALRYREALQEIASYPPGTLRPLADEIAIHRLAIEALGSRSAVETAAPHAYFEEWYCEIYARRPDAFQGSKAALRSAWEAGAESVCRSAAADGEGAGVKAESHPTGGATGAQPPIATHPETTSDAEDAARWRFAKEQMNYSFDGENRTHYMKADGREDFQETIDRRRGSSEKAGEEHGR
jgi:hypothetical protein